jgi:hypothetical protein
MSPDETDTPTLTAEQAYEAAYRFVAQYYERERIVPFMLMLTAMRPQRTRFRRTTLLREATGFTASMKPWLGTHSRSRPPHRHKSTRRLPPYAASG